MRKLAIKALHKPITGSIVSVLVGFLIGAVVLAAAGYNPLEAYGAMFAGIFNKPKYMAQVVINAVPIILTGLSVAFAFKTGLFNIGAEGQYVVGSIAAAMFGRYVPLPPVIHPIFVILMAFLLGGIFGGLAGWLKTKFGIHEVISTIMLNWIALYLNNFVLNLPGVKKEGTQASHEVLDSARIQLLGEW
ncbi:MAG: ABC transporter permease, partial [Sporomusa sp.]